MTGTADDASLQGWLERVRSEYWEQLGRPDSSGGLPGCSHVLFEVAGARFAIEAPLCKGVLRRPRTTRLPGLPEYLLGVAGIRGEVVSVVDPKSFLALPGVRAAGLEGYLLVVASGEVKAALWVDRVNDVVDLAVGEVLAAEVPWAGLPKGVLLGQWGEGETAVFVLDGEKLLRMSAVGEGG